MTGELNNLTLITGGARCGKSRSAEALAAASNLPVFYMATMEIWSNDKEGVERVRRHQQRRPEDWITQEVPKNVHEAIYGLPKQEAFVIIDCLSVYVSNLLLGHCDKGQDPYKAEREILEAVAWLIKAIEENPDKQFIVVTNEVGFGVVPDTVLGRAYRDFLGYANQSVAQVADKVILMCSGLPLPLK